MAKFRRRSSRKSPFAPVTLSESGGVRYLHFGSEWIQGAMRVKRPDWPELEYVQQMMAWMLFQDRPRAILQLGLGTGALTKFCYREFPKAAVTAVEINPEVISICHAMFKLPPDDDRLTVLQMDAMDYVCDASHHGKADILQVDLYDADAHGPVLDSPEFYAACAACLKPDGIMAVNLFGDHPSYDKNLHVMEAVFPRVLCLPEIDAGNIVAFAFKNGQKLDFQTLYDRAMQVEDATGLPARKWVSGLKSHYSS